MSVALPVPEHDDPAWNRPLSVTFRSVWGMSGTPVNVVESVAMPVVVVTADATPGLTRRLQSVGATAFLTKPLDIQGVLDLIDGVLGDKTKIQ